MKLRLLLFALAALPMFIVDASSQIGRNYIPYFIDSEYLHNYPQFKNLPLYHRLRHNPDHPIPKDNYIAPEKFMSEDGIEIVNTSSMWKNAQTETWIAVNPLNPLNVIATSNDNEYISGHDGFRMSAFVTDDGGKTWRHSPTPRNSGQWITPSGTRATIFDPGIAFDSKGHAYYVYGFASTDGSEEESSDRQNGVFVVKSTDGGSTWDGIKSGSPNGINAVTTDAFSASGNPFHDMYSIACDFNPNSPHKDNVYISWRVFRGVDGIVFSRSTDGGESFSNYTKIANGGQAPVPAVGPNGEVYLTWIGMGINSLASAMFTRSTDGGQSFSSPIEAQRVTSIGNLNPKNGRHELNDKRDIRVSSPPQIAVDISNSTYRGNIYIVQAGREATSGLYGIYLAKSTNGGSVWQKKNFRIDNSQIRNDMYFPSISCDPVTGMVAVLYYSSQNHPSNKLVDAYVAISMDGGDTWRHIKVSPFSHSFEHVASVFGQGPTGGVYWGDYTSISVYNSRIYPLFWMSSHPSALYSLNDLYTALLSPAPKQPTNLSADVILVPKVAVKINWVHPIHNLLGDVLTDFKINVYRNNVKIGEVSKSQSASFVDNDVVSGVSYSYSLQAETPNGLLSNLTYISAIAGGNPKPMPPTNISWRPNTNGIIISWRNPSENVEGKDMNEKLKFVVLDYNTEAVLGTFEDNLAVGEISTAMLNLPTEKYYRLRFKSITVRGSIETSSDYSQESLIAYAGAPLSVLTETFDDAENMTPHYKEGTWGLTTAKASSPPNSFTDSPSGNYLPNRDDVLMFPPVVIQAGKSTFSFEHIALIDTATQTREGQLWYDVGAVSWTKDFGKTWNYYHFWNAGSSPNFILKDLANSQWEKVAKDMSQFIGDTIIFRFSMITNGFREAEGWYIDNVELNDSPSGVDSDIITQSRIFTFPNPVSDNSQLQIDLTRSANINVSLYNSLGIKVMDLSDEFVMQGRKVMKFDLSTINSGLYFYRINMDGITKTIPISIVR
jgi:hypothetical protein